MTKNEIQARCDTGERGAVLVMSLMAVTVVAVLAGAFVQLVSATVNRQAGAVDRKRAFYAAEAGIAEAYVAVLQGRSGNVGTPEQPAAFSQGLFWVTATDLGDRKVELEATGMYGRARSKVSLVVERGEENTLDLGFFAGGPLQVQPGSQIDSYDSRLGPYAGQSHSAARLMSNVGVALEGSPSAPTVIKGDVAVGPGGAISSVGDVTVTGAQASLPEPIALPPVSVPSVPYSLGGVIDSPYPKVVAPTVQGLQKVSVAPGSELVLQGPSTIVIDDLTVQPDAQLTFDTSGGPIRLFVKNSLDLQAGSLIQTSGYSAREVMVVVPDVTNRAVTLRSTGAFHGIVYAPATTVLVSSSFEVFGALGAQNVSLEGPAQLHFDVDLVRLSKSLESPTQVSWRLVELAVQAGPPVDACDILGVPRGSLGTPASSREDQWLDLKYIDTSGTPRTYSGMESGFNWTVVGAVLNGSRDGETLVRPKRDRLKAWGDALGVSVTSVAL